jgi:hypothetical protein
MANRAKTTAPSEKLPSQWRSRAYNWGDGSGDLALPIPRRIQRAHQLNEHSIVQVRLVRGKLVISLVDPATQAALDKKNGLKGVRL